MTTVDELLKAHPLPYRVVAYYGERRTVRDARGAWVAEFDVGDTYSDDVLESFCDAVNELARLRDTNDAWATMYEAKLEELATLRARNAELEAELGRLNDQEKPGCTDANCVFGGQCGMRTNGGCSCLDDIRPSIRANSMRAKIRGMRTRVVELEAFAERTRAAINRASREARFGDYASPFIARIERDIFGPGPLPWDEKGGVK